MRWVDPPGLYAISSSTPVLLALKSGATGVATVGSSVALALVAGLLIGTGINEFVVEPYIADPLFDWWFPVHDPMETPLPQPSPAPSPKPTDQDTDNGDDCSPDDFGRWCRKEEMKKITIYSINDGSYGHASLKVEGHVVGWWPVSSYSGLYDHLVIVDGRRRNRIDRMLVNDPVRYPRLEVKYNACAPQNDPINNSIVAINMSIMVHSNGEFNLLNAGARNCAGWVCQVLSWAGWAPLAPKQKLYTPGPEQVTCHTPGLVPIHLVPEGLTKELYNIEEIRKRIREEHYHF